jgi:hypothetical protein
LFFAEASSSSPRASSCAGSAPRGSVPPSTSALTWFPARLTSSSGVAPIIPSQENVKQSG